MTLTFEVADSDDWSGIWEVFREVVATGDTYPYLPDMSEDEARGLWMRTGEREATFVARREGEVVGTAYVRSNGTGLADHIANAGWMIEPRSQGQGIGRPFAEHVIEEARRLGYHGMQFNGVVSSNTGAVALWKSLGFEIVGTVPDAFRHSRGEMVPVHIMYRRL